MNAPLASGRRKPAAGLHPGLPHLESMVARPDSLAPSRGPHSLGRCPGTLPWPLGERCGRFAPCCCASSALVWIMSHDFSLGTVEVALAPLERFEEFLQSRGKRITQQRRIIVERVFSRHDHFDADDLLAQLRAARRRAQRQPADRLSHAERTGRRRPAAQDDPRRPGRLRARLRLSAARSPALPEVRQADRVLQRRSQGDPRSRRPAAPVPRHGAPADHHRASAPSAAARSGPRGGWI